MRQVREVQNLNIALTWGEQKTEDKERAIRSFMDGSSQVLVSTTVIEVGVNNPNATVMVIENAERFGLSQLHQLRGRVGRGTEESWCFLLSDATDKLQILCSTNDGFEISRKDLELRGPGDLIGTRQSGDAAGPFAGGDARLLDEVAQTVRELHRDPSMSGILEQVEAYARAYFEEYGHQIAMN